MSSDLLKLFSVGMDGLDPAFNNVTFGLGRYIFVAPYAPSKDPQRIEDLNNNSVSIIDARRPDKVKQVVLGNCYYPTRVLFDETSQTVVVRGTHFTPSGDGYSSTEVLAYFHLRLEPDLTTDQIVMIPIPGAGSPVAESAPNDIALSGDGRTLLFCNDKSFFTFSLLTGVFYEKPVVPLGDAEHKISHLSIDPETNTVVVAITKEEAEGGGIRFSSELLFYQLVVADGSLNLLKQVAPDTLPRGGALPPESNVIITSDESGAEAALFVTDTGSLCQVLLRGNDQRAAVKEIGYFDLLSKADPRKASARVLSYDATSKVLAISVRGYIRKPANGRPGRPGGIRKPANIRVWLETPGLALVQLGKKNKIVREKQFSTEFQDGFGLSELVFDNHGGQSAFVSTYNGKFFRLGLSGGVSQASAELLGELGSRIDALSYFGDRSTFVALSSLDEEGLLPGSVVLARLVGAGSPNGISLDFSKQAERSWSGIRRPGNVISKDKYIK